MDDMKYYFGFLAVAALTYGGVVAYDKYSQTECLKSYAASARSVEDITKICVLPKRS